MRRNPDVLLAGMRADHIPAAEAGPWTIEKFDVRTVGIHAAIYAVGSLHPFTTWTALSRTTLATLNNDHGECVMEDSPRELRRHLPILMRARGRVLVTGLGLGCVVRGLLALPEVEHVDVIEVDPWILRLVAPSFDGVPKLTIHHADALTWPIPHGAQWDFAWHDIWTEGPVHLDVLHMELITRFQDHVTAPQGAWQMAREAKQVIRRRGYELLGAKRRAFA